MTGAPYVTFIKAEHLAFARPFSIYPTAEKITL